MAPQPPVPELPDWVPPVNSGKESASDLNRVAKRPRRTTVAGENSPIPVVYGRDRLAGRLVGLYGVPNVDFFVAQFAFCEGPVEAFEKIMIDGVDVAGPGGYLSAEFFDKLPFTDHPPVEEHLGETGEAQGFWDQLSFTNDWENVAYVTVVLSMDVLPGFPTVEAVVRGQRLYDPRLDDTAGGSGTHRRDVPETWAYSANPALALADFAYHKVGWGVDWDSVIDAADECDAMVGDPGNQQARREIGLTMYSPATPDSWLRALRTYAGVMVSWENGVLRLIPERADVGLQGAIYLDGSQSPPPHVNCGSGPDLTTVGKTVELWFRGGSASCTYVQKKASLGAGDPGFALYMLLNAVVFRFADAFGSEDYVVASGQVDIVNDGEWHHLAVTYTSSPTPAGHVYVDGAEVASSLDSGAVVADNWTSGEDLLIGEGTLASFDGEIDEVRLWGAARSAAEIAAGMGGEVDPQHMDLVAYWRLNERTGGAAADATGSGHDGTWENGATFAAGAPELLPSGVVRHFTADDILKNSLRVRKKGSREFPTVVQVEYTDGTTDDFRPRIVSVSAPGVAAGTLSRRISRVRLPGIHRHAQARREAVERLNWFLSDLEVTFTAFDEGAEVQHGSVIAVTHPIGLTAKQLRVRQITGRGGRWTLDAVEYDPGAYSDEVIDAPAYPDTQLPSPLDPATVSNVVAREKLFTLKNGTTASRLQITWAQPTDYPFTSRYLVEGWADTGDGPERIFQVLVPKGVSEALSPQVDQLVQTDPVEMEVRVYVQTPVTSGDPATSVVTILGKLLPPGDVPSVTATRTGSGTVALAWEAAVDIDVWRYELRIAPGVPE